MPQNDGFKKLKLALKVFAFFSLFYGVGFLFIPGILVGMSGEESVSLGWIRWSGGPLLAMGIGAILAHRNPERQGVFTLVAAIGSLFIALGLLYSVFFDASKVYTWFHMTPCYVNFGLFALLLWGRRSAQQIPA